jgi:hypothetical protein
MSYRGVCNWPPFWAWIGGERNDHPRGELGILKRVRPPGESLPLNRLFLIIDYKQSEYIGCLLFDDPLFCVQVEQMLKPLCGRPISEIGGFDLTHTL